MTALEQTYSSGDIVNGHVVDGQQWLPIGPQQVALAPAKVTISTGEHIIHAVLSAVTFGFWIPVWIIRAVMASRRIG